LVQGGLLDAGETAHLQFGTAPGPPVHQGRQCPGEGLRLLEVLGSPALGQPEGEIAEGGKTETCQLAVDRTLTDSSPAALEEQDDREDLPVITGLDPALVIPYAFSDPSAGPALDLGVH
jgi:hypothetical protein